MKKLVLIILMGVFALPAFSQLVLLKSDTLAYPDSEDVLIKSIYFKAYTVQVSPTFIQFDDVYMEERIAHFPDTTITFKRSIPLPIVMHDDDEIQVGQQMWNFMQVLEFIHTNNVEGIQTVNEYMLYRKGY